VAVNSVVDDRMASGRGRLPDLAGEVRDQRAGLAARLGLIGRSRSQQEAIAARSYWHPNGFVKLVLEDHPRHGQLRLHVWPTLPDDHGDVHGHAWNYASVVVDGELCEMVYEETPSDDGWEMWRHSYPRVGDRRFMLTDPVPVRLRTAGPPVVLRSGDTSGGSPDHVHCFYASSTPAVTMLRVGPVLVDCSHVYRPTAEPEQAVVPRPTSRADVAEWVDHTMRVAVASPSLAAVSS
jgi:hypothetical protein